MITARLKLFVLFLTIILVQACRQGETTDKQEEKDKANLPDIDSENPTNKRELEISSLYMMQKGQGVILLELKPMELIINVFPDNDLNNPIQSIGPLKSNVEYNENYYLDDPRRIFNPADLNFDGHADIRIPIASGTDETWYAVYLFNASKKQFEEHPELSTLVSLEADSVSKTLTSHQAGGMGGAFYTHESYQWNQGKLVLVRRENQVVFYADNPEVLLRSVVERNAQQRFDTTALVKIWNENNQENWCLLKGDWSALEGSPFLSEEAVKTDGRKAGCD